MKKVKKKTKKKKFVRYTNAETGKSWPHKEKNKKKVVSTKTKRKYSHIKLSELPTFYMEHFLQRIDKRSELWFHLNRSYQQIVEDLGGIEKISSMELTLIDRLIFLIFIVRKREVSLFESEDYSKESVLEVRQLGNQITSLCSRLGITRRQDQAVDLAEYLKRNKEDEE